MHSNFKLKHLPPIKGALAHSAARQHSTDEPGKLNAVPGAAEAAVTAKDITDIRAELKYLLCMVNPHAEVDEAMRFQNPEPQIAKMQSATEDEKNAIRRQHLVKVFKRVLGTGFHFYLNDTFSIGQTKAFCSKHLLADLKETMEHSDSVETVKELNRIVKEITDANLKRYPQKEPSGVSPKVKQVVKEINRLEDDAYDFLHLNGISISNRADGNYFDKIMTTINRMIELPYELVRPEVSSTLLDLFRQTVECMAVCCTDEGHKRLRSEVADNMKSRPSEKGQKAESDGVKGKGSLENHYIEFVREKVLKLTQIKLQKESEHLAESEGIVKGILGLQSLFDLTQEESERLTEDFEELSENGKVREAMKSFAANSKIAAKVRKFSKEEIENGSFTISDSTVIRIITKWAQELQSYFSKPYETIYKKTNKFKTNGHGFVDFLDYAHEVSLNEFHNFFVNFLSSSDKEVVKELLQTITKENIHNELLFSKQKIKSLYLQQTESKVGIFSSEVYNLYGLYMSNYLNLLIGELTKMPIELLKEQAIFGERQYDSRNRQKSKSEYTEEEQKTLGALQFVTNKMGDLIRAKFSCSEKGFIRLMHLFESFDEQNPSFIKIVRVKNRLSKKDNDVMINFLFLNKIQCEFQLSIQSSVSAKEVISKKTNEFNHFLYEISRAVLGPISQLSCILCEYDPLISEYFMKDIDNLGKKVKFVKEADLEENHRSSNFDREKNQQKGSQLQVYARLIPILCQNCGKAKIRTSSVDWLSVYCKSCVLKEKIKIPSSPESSEKTRRNDLLVSFSDNKDLLTKESLQIFVESDEKFSSNIHDVVGVYVNMASKNPQPHLCWKVNHLRKLHIITVKDRLQDKVQSDGKQMNRNYEVLATFDLHQVFECQYTKMNSNIFWFSKGVCDSKRFSTLIQQEKFKGIVNSSQLQFYQEGFRLNSKFHENYSQSLKRDLNLLELERMLKINSQTLKLNPRNIQTQSSEMKANIKRLKRYFNKLKTITINQVFTLKTEQIDWIDDLPNVQHINLRRNAITKLVCHNNAERLSSLNLSDGCFSDLESFQHFTRLKELNLSGNSQIQNVNAIEQFITLQSLNVSRTGICQLKLSHLNRLKVLKMNSCLRLSHLLLNAGQSMDVLEINNYNKRYSKVFAIELQRVKKLEIQGHLLEGQNVDVQIDFINHLKITTETSFGSRQSIKRCKPILKRKIDQGPREEIENEGQTSKLIKEGESDQRIQINTGIDQSHKMSSEKCHIESLIIDHPNYLLVTMLEPKVSLEIQRSDHQMLFVRKSEGKDEASFVKFLNENPLQQVVFSGVFLNHFRDNQSYRQYDTALMVIIYVYQMDLNRFNLDQRTKLTISKIKPETQKDENQIYKVKAIQPHAFEEHVAVVQNHVRRIQAIRNSEFVNSRVIPRFGVESLIFDLDKVRPGELLSDNYEEWDRQLFYSIEYNKAGIFKPIVEVDKIEAPFTEPELELFLTKYKWPNLRRIKMAGFSLQSLDCLIKGQMCKQIEYLELSLVSLTESTLTVMSSSVEFPELTELCLSDAKLFLPFNFQILYRLIECDFLRNFPKVRAVRVDMRNQYQEQLQTAISEFEKYRDAHLKSKLSGKNL